MSQKIVRRSAVRFKFHRLKAVLALRCQPFEDFYRALPVTARHAHFVLTNARAGSAALLDAIRHQLGDHAWQFATGEVDTLTDAGPAVEMASHAAA